MKKLFLLFAACLACTLSTFAYDFEVDGIYYNLLGGDSVEVTYIGSSPFQYDEYSGSVTLSETIEHNSTTYRVTSIGNEAFRYCSDLTAITLPNSVTSIGDNAFSGCSSLTAITIPNSITTIGSSAFSGCSSFEAITVEAGNPTYHSTGNCLIETAAKTLIAGCKNSIIPTDGSVTAIGDAAFSGCSSLTAITIPNSITTIGSSAFSGCSSLTEITLPNSITTIGDDTFYWCSSLTEITLPNSITTIGDDTFYWCSSLKAVTLPNSVTTIGDDAFYGCSSLTEITLPNSVTTIGDYAFWDCSSLTAITLPNSVTTIGNYAFDYCSRLTAVTCFAQTPPSISETTFNNSHPVIFVLYESVEAYKSAQYWSKLNIKALKFESNCIYYQHIGGDSVEVTYKGDYYQIYDNEYSGSVTIPETVTYNNTTYRVTTIGGSAFSDCSSLTEVTIPNSVTTIGDGPFSYCSSLEIITVEAGNSTYHSVGNCIIETATKALHTGCKNSIIPTDGSVTSIGDNAFLGCSSLTTVTIPNSVTTIGDNAFCRCSSLTYITSLAATPPTTASNAFEYVPTGAEVTVPCGAAPSYRVEWPSFQYVNEDFIYDFNVTTSNEDAGLVQIIQEPSCSRAAIIKALPMDGYVFKAWSDGNTRSMRQITVEEDINLVAYFIAIDGSDNTENIGGITVDPADNSVTFTWPSVGGAVTYVFDIYADAAQTDRICTLTCNAIGQLINISFPRNKPAAIQEGTLLNFTIDGLDESTTYSYTLKTYDADDTLIASHTGMFKTTGVTTAVETPYIASPDGVRKVIENGVLYILRNGERYTIDGRKM